jgi:uncharacterized protein (TIGR02217 family)
MSLPIFPGSSFPGLKIATVRRRMSSTVIQAMVNGNEARVANWLYPRYAWPLEFEALRNDVQGSSPRNLELQDLMSFASSLSGAWAPFAFADLFTPDYTVTAQFIANGDGSKTTFQLVRTLGTVTEPVYILNNLGLVTPNFGWVQPQVFLNGVLQSGGAWTMNADTGILTFTSAPGLGVAITATFSFFWKTRFDTDVQEFVEQWSTVWATNSPLVIVSILQ